MLIKENGEGLPDANAYADDDDAADYLSTRGLDWTAPLEQREAALIRATDFIDANYTFGRERLRDDQALEFPRTLSRTVPRPLIRATIELALVALNDNLFAPSDGRTVTSLTEKVGDLETSTTWQAATNSDPHRQISQLLAGVGYRRGAGAASFLLRA